MRPGTRLGREVHTGEVSPSLEGKDSDKGVDISPLVLGPKFFAGTPILGHVQATGHPRMISITYNSTWVTHSRLK